MKEEKRQKIMRAAEALFSGGRIHEITMDEVARKAGVGKGTLYRYFKNKDDLFFEVALSGFDEMCEMVRLERQASADFRACLINICRRVSDFYRGRRQLMHMMQVEERRALQKRGASRTFWLSRRRCLVAALTSVLEAGQSEGEVRRDLALDVVAVMLLGMLRTRGRESRADNELRIDNETVVDLFLHGAAGEARANREPAP